MKRTILFTFAQGMITIALVSACKADGTNAPTTNHRLRIMLSTKATTIVSGLIDVQGDVVSTSTNETIRYTSWLKTKFLDKATGEYQEVEQSFILHDKSLCKVEPGATNIFLGTLGGPPGLSEHQFSGKGTVFVYATTEGTNGIENRISNLIVLNADIENSKITVVEEKP